MILDESCIKAYLTPHPLEEENDFDDELLSWLHGFVNQPDEEQGIPAYLRDENIALYASIEEDAKARLIRAINNLWPLLKNHHFTSVQILIDLFGILISKNAIAGYNYEDSAPAEGNYIFILSNPLLHMYQISKTKNIPLHFHDEHTWEHELIHLIDHFEIVKGKLYRSSLVPSELIQASILEFRNEGIADLYYLMHGYHESICSIDDAKNSFRKHILGWKKRNSSINKVDNESKKDLISTQLFYSAGPWLILDLLRSYQGGWFHEITDNCLAMIQRKEAIEHDTILKVIKTALQIDSRTFLDYGEALLES